MGWPEELESSFTDPQSAALPYKLRPQLVDLRGIEPRFLRCKRSCFPLAMRDPKLHPTLGFSPMHCRQRLGADVGNLERSIGLEPMLMRWQRNVLATRRRPRKLERVVRIELTSGVWKTPALPLDDTRENGSGSENRTPVVGLRYRCSAD